MKGYKLEKMLGVGVAVTMLCALSGCSADEPSGNLMDDYRVDNLTQCGLDEPGQNQLGQADTDGGRCTYESPNNFSVGDENFYEDGTLALSDLGVRLMQECYDGDKNVLISPVSVISALGMTANGADGATLAEMEDVFGMEISVLNGFLKEYRENLPDGEKYKMNLANGIWFRDSGDFAVKESFLRINAEYYDAGLFKSPFDNSTKDEINGWVKQNTNGMIQSILDEIPADAVMYLVNALAFDGEWQTIYNESRVRQGEFTAENGEKQDVTMMYSEERRYLEDENVQGFLKYYTDEKYAFVGLLPKENVTVEEYLSGLDGETLQNLLDNPMTVKVNAGIPKFQLEYDVELGTVLQAMGMVDAFSENEADLSGLGNAAAGNLFVSRVLHKTFVAVDERGTKAGAATAVEVKCESAMLEPEEIKTVILDRPFLYMIIDCEKQVPLIIGTVQNLNKN